MAPRKTSTGARPAAAQIMPTAAYRTALGTTAAGCRAILAARGAATKGIPGNIRRTTSTLARLAETLDAYWAKNTPAYNALIAGAVPAKPAAKARRAGA